MHKRFPTARASAFPVQTVVSALPQPPPLGAPSLLSPRETAAAAPHSNHTHAVSAPVWPLAVPPHLFPSAPVAGPVGVVYPILVLHHVPQKERLSSLLSCPCRAPWTLLSRWTAATLGRPPGWPPCRCHAPPWCGPTAPVRGSPAPPAAGWRPACAPDRGRLRCSAAAAHAVLRSAGQPRQTHLAAGQHCPWSRSAAAVLNTCSTDALAEMLRFLKRCFWPFAWDSGAGSGGGFAGAAKVFLEGESDAAMQASAAGAVAQPQ